MESNITIHDENKPKIDIESKILVIRGQYVMIDRDLAELYGVETKRLNEQVRRNIERFPEHFMFQLTREEQIKAERFLRSQFATLEIGNEDLRGKHSKYLSYAFTEQGVAMLSAEVTIYTHPKTEISALDIQKFNEQYPAVTLKYTENIHDRFLIVDNKILYHVGASFKDLAKKCFGFETMDSSWIPEILRNL